MIVCSDSEIDGGEKSFLLARKRGWSAKLLWMPVSLCENEPRTGMMTSGVKHKMGKSLSEAPIAMRIRWEKISSRSFLSCSVRQLGVEDHHI